MQLRLLELRKERLESLRKAIERGVPIDELLQGRTRPAMKQSLRCKRIASLKGSVHERNFTVRC